MPIHITYLAAIWYLVITLPNDPKSPRASRQFFLLTLPIMSYKF